MTQAQTFDALAFVKAKRAERASGFNALEFVKRKRAEKLAAASTPPAPSPLGQEAQGPITGFISGAIRGAFPTSGFLADEAARALVRGGIGIPESAAGAVQGAGGTLETLGRMGQVAPAAGVVGARMLVQNPGAVARNMLLGPEVAPLPLDATAQDIMRAANQQADADPVPMVQAGRFLRNVAEPAMEFYGQRKADPAIAPSPLAQAQPFSPSGLTSSVAENLPQLAVQLAAAYMSGGAGASGRIAGFAGSAFPMELGAAQAAGREGFIQQGVSPEDAALKAAPGAALQAAVNTIIESASGAGIFAPAEKAAAKAGLFRQAWEIMRRGARAGATGGVTEAAQEGVNIAGELASGSNPNAGQGAGMRMLQAGVVGGLLEGPAGAFEGGRESAVRPGAQPTAQTTQPPIGQAPDNPTAPPDNRGQAPDPSPLDEAAALAEQRLNQQFNTPAPVGSPLADQAASSQPEQGAVSDPTASVLPASQTGPVVGGATSPSPQSTREPWQMTRGEYRDWSYTKEYREARSAAEQADKDAENAVIKMEQEIGVDSRSAMQGLSSVDGVSPKAFGLVQAADAMRQQKEFNAALEAMPEQFRKKYADAVAKWERAHARARSFEDFNTAQEMAKEYGLSNPSESPKSSNSQAPVSSSNPPAKPDSSTQPQGQGAVSDPTASVLLDLGINPADFAARVEQARVDQYRANPQQAYLDGNITRDQLVAFLEQRVANDPGEQLRRQAEARATGPQREMRRVDINPRPAVTINPNAQQQTAQQRRVPDRLDIVGRARKITEAIGKGWILDRRFGLMDTRQQEDMIRAGERLDPIWGETIKPEADQATLERLGIARVPQARPEPAKTPQGRAGTLADLLGMDSEADAQRYTNTLSPSERERLGLPQRAPEVQQQGQGSDSPTTTPAPKSTPPAKALQGTPELPAPSSSPSTEANRPVPSPQSTREPWQMTRGEYEGQSKVWNHQTWREFSAFDMKEARRLHPRRADSIDSLGFWFTDAKNTRMYGPVNVASRVEVKNPYSVKDTDNKAAWSILDEEMKRAGGPQAFREKLIRDGHDGVVLENTRTDMPKSSGESHNILIAFDPAQIEMIARDVDASAFEGQPTKPTPFSKHRAIVEAAHAAGKPVPPEVLAEYGLKPNPPAKPDSSTQPQGQAAATTNKERTNGEEEAPQAQVLNTGTVAPAPAQGTGAVSAEPFTRTDGTAKEAGTKRVEELRATFKTKRAGWHFAETDEGATLIHPTEDRVVRFKANQSNQTSRARTYAQAFADDNPVKTEQTAPGQLKVQELKAPQPAPAKVKGKKPHAKPAPDKKITDAGDKIGGARKDVWAKRGLTVADIEKMNDREAFKHTNKDAAWPKPDYEAMVAAGVEPTAARLLKIIRDRIAATPKDTHDDRVRFLQGMAVIRPLWDAAKTVADVKALANNVMVAFGFQKAATDRMPIPGWQNTPEAKQYFALFKDRKSPFELRYIDERRAAREIAAGWPAKKGEGAEWFDIRKRAEGAFYLFKKSNQYKPVVRDVFTSEEAARAFAAEHFDKGGRQKTNGPQRPTVEGVTRSGPDYRKGRDIDSNEFREAFGFRGVEFGNWMTQADRQQTMNHAYDGLMDLATAMGIPPLAVSLNGHLAAAFGARGVGGQRAAAHYEPTRRVFNLTKFSGQGSLAHEWGHAFDDYLGTLTGKATNQDPYATASIKKPGNTLRPEVLDALRKVIKTIREVPATVSDDVAAQTDRLNKAKRQFGLWIDGWKKGFADGRTVRGKTVKPTAEQVQQFNDLVESARNSVAPAEEIDKAAELYGSVYKVNVAKDTANALRHYAEAIPRMSKTIADLLAGERAPAGTMDTAVLAASKKADSQKTKPLWSTDVELFARMFEMWVYDRLAADAGKKNVGVSQYLVNNISEAEAASPMYWQGVHAFGTERTAIGQAMGELVASLRVQDTVDGEVTADAPVKTNASTAERAMSTLERIAADAAARMEARAKKRGSRLYSTILPMMHPLDVIDTSAWVAAHALRAGIKGGRALTSFISTKLAERFPNVQYDKRAVRKTVAAYLKNATTEKDIYDAWKSANARESNRRIAAVAGESPSPKAVKEAAATGAAERPDVAAKIIDAVKRGLRQGRAEGMRTASDALKPLIRQARDAAKRARQVAAIETRGAVDAAKAAAADRAATEKGIRDQAVRLVQETPIAGRRKYLKAVASAATMSDLARILHRLRGDLAKETGRHFALRAEKLEKNLRTLNADRRENARKLIDDVRKLYALLRDKDTGTARREEIAEQIRESFEALNTIFHEQKNQDKVSILGRAIQAGEHREQMVANIEKRPELPAPSNPNKKRDKGRIRQALDKFLTFQSLMQALDQEFYGNGIFARAGRAMSERHTAELAKVQEFTDRADKMARKYGYKGLGEFLAKSSGALGEASQKWLNVSLGEFKRITLGNAMDIYARDPETREKMHRGQTFTFDAEGGSHPFTIPDSKFAEIENALTPQEKGMAMEMNKLRSEMQFERMSDVYKMLTGNYLVRVPWHYPIRRAMKLSESPDITKGLGEWTIKRMEEAGYLKQRVGGNAPIVVGDFGMTQLRQFQMGEAFIQRASIVKYLGATMLHPDVRKAVVRHHGTKIMDRIQQTISEFSGNESPQQDRLMRRLLSNIARAQTQVNIGTWARNLATAFNIPLAVVDGKLLGVRKTLRGIAGALSSPAKTMRILMKHSPDLRHRWSHAGASISLMHGNDVQASTDIADTAFGDASKATVRQILTALKAIKAGDSKNQTAEIARPWRQLLDAIKLGNVFDGFGAMVAYHAVRADAPASLSPGAADKWAARRAADIFSQTANTNDLLNSNEWQMDARRSTWTAGLLAFTSDIAKKQNLLYLATKRGKKATAYATAAVTLGALWSVAITAALSGALGDDEDKVLKRAGEGLAKEFASLSPGGTFLSSLVEAGFNPRGSASILDTPITAVIKNTQTAIIKFQDAAENGDDADVMEGAYRVLRILNDISGAPFGPTAGMVKRAVVNYGTE